MRLRWDWLRPTIVVPYLPTIGPVHPDALDARLFADVIAVADTGQFLGYDKDRRWWPDKAETVVVDAIAQHRDMTLVPTLSRRGNGTISVYRYGSATDGHRAALEMARDLGALNRVDVGRVVWFAGPEEEPPPADHVSRVQLAQLDADQPAVAARNVRLLDGCPPPVKATFASFAESLAAEGFGFLRDRVETGGVGPILVAVDDGCVVGAIGPMEIQADPAGRPRLLPPYFAVAADNRRRGHGRALWRSAMHWGHSHAASYQLLQTEIGGASDYLCAAEGLRSLGFVCTTNL